MLRQLLSVVLALSVVAAVCSAASKSSKYDKYRRPGPSSSRKSSGSSKPPARYNPAVERIRFFTAAGKDSELNDKEFNSDRSKGKGFVRKADSWSAMLRYDKDRNKTIDWFEADAYRRSQYKTTTVQITTIGKAVVVGGTSDYSKMSKEQIWKAMTPKYDTNGDGKLEGKEKSEAYKEYKRIREHQEREERERRERERREHASRSRGSSEPIEATFGGHRYSVLKKRVSWEEAVKECEALGGHLVTIESSEELAFVKRLAGSSRLWVGATDRAREGQWVWLSGRPVPQGGAMWKSGEPNGKTECNYASITSSGLYDSGSPYGSVSGMICEWGR